jgi:hypothetical protein
MKLGEVGPNACYDNCHGKNESEMNVGDRPGGYNLNMVRIWVKPLTKLGMKGSKQMVCLTAYE